VEIELLTVPDCPNRRVALERLNAALSAVGNPPVRIAETVIGDQGQARAAGMHGSPTIPLDGRDPFADPDVVTSVSCRLYRSDAGLDGAPSIEQLTTAMATLIDPASARD
jgi:hypothetical protein